MTKYLLVLFLLSSYSYANKNWIEFDGTDNSKMQNETDLQMYSSKSSLQGIIDSSESNKTSNLNSSDKELLEVFKKIQDVTQQIQAKIKK